MLDIERNVLQPVGEQFYGLLWSLADSLFQSNRSSFSATGQDQRFKTNYAKYFLLSPISPVRPEARSQTVAGSGTGSDEET